MKDLYLLSGLGADKRVFDFIDLSGFNVHHVNWIAPVMGESIESYAKRLLPQIVTSRPVIIGISFGGMIATEIARLIDTERVVLISSAETVTDIPRAFRMIGRSRLYRVLPPGMLKSANGFMYWLFGLTGKRDKALLKLILFDTDTKFLLWAVDAIAHWTNRSRLSNVVRIHGSADRILPMRKAEYVVQNGGHLMIVNKAAEVSNLIKKILA